MFNIKSLCYQRINFETFSGYGQRNVKSCAINHDILVTMVTKRSRWPLLFCFVKIHVWYFKGVFVPNSRKVHGVEIAWSHLFTLTIWNAIVEQMTFFKSGVPQGTVLGPLMFLIYIGDGVKSQIRLFADGSLLYGIVNGEEDTKALQEDLDKLVKRSDKWQMILYINKCRTLRVHRSKTPSINHYTIRGPPLKSMSHHP